MTRKLNVIELFAGVGGFRVGLEKANKSFFETI
ncbi:DNA cytosine methyltransferase, partial [Klebsiella pneumoniae]|nr:DNA cytosine methyltransferase [Klebsiella pneumoniae]